MKIMTWVNLLQQNICGITIMLIVPHIHLDMTDIAIWLMSNVL